MSGFDAKEQIIADALASAEVACAAEKDPADWANYHIFYEFSDVYIGARNRGRLPFVEFNIDDSNFEQVAVDSNLDTNTWIVRVHVGQLGINTNRKSMTSKAQAIARTFIAKLKENIQLRGTSVNISSLTTTPIGGFIEITMDFEDMDCDYTYREED